MGNLKVKNKEEKLYKNLGITKINRNRCNHIEINEKILELELSPTCAHSSNCIIKDKQMSKDIIKL
jgi:hypothetical protein